MRISDWSSDVCSSDLAAEAHTLLHALDRIELLQALQALLLGELGLEHPHGLRSVLELRPLHLARHDDARREVREADSRRRLVDVLATGTRCPEHVHLDVALVALYVAVAVVVHREARPRVR